MVAAALEVPARRPTRSTISRVWAGWVFDCSLPLMRLPSSAVALERLYLLLLLRSLPICPPRAVGFNCVLCSLAMAPRGVTSVWWFFDCSLRCPLPLMRLLSSRAVAFERLFLRLLRFSVPLTRCPPRATAFKCVLCLCATAPRGVTSDLSSSIQNCPASCRRWCLTRSRRGASTSIGSMRSLEMSCVVVWLTFSKRRRRSPPSGSMAASALVQYHSAQHL